MKQCYLFLSWLEFCCTTGPLPTDTSSWRGYWAVLFGAVTIEAAVDVLVQVSLWIGTWLSRVYSEGWRGWVRRFIFRLSFGRYCQGAMPTVSVRSTCPTPCWHRKELQHPTERAVESHSHFLYCAFPRCKCSDLENLCIRWLVIGISASRWYLFVPFVHFKIGFSLPRVGVFTALLSMSFA